MNVQPSLPVADIQVGTRHRREMGDIEALAQNIADIGLLHPVVVTPGGQLIAGERRLLAYRHLGRDRIPATVLDLDQIVRGEYAENFFRKAFVPSEYADIADALEPLERQAAKERQKEHRGTAPGRKQSGEIPHTVDRRALDHVARAVGKDRKTIIKAREVRDAAKADPARFGKLAADMDRTGRVDGPFKRLTVMQQAAAIRAEPPPYPGNGPYRVIVADPPWPYELRKTDPSHRATHPYPQMSIADICAEAPKVGEIAHQDCILWLWTTRGRPVVHLTNQTTAIHGPLHANSQKPDEFLVFVERLCPANRYAELFSRDATRDMWDCHGDEVQSHALEDAP